MKNNFLVLFGIFMMLVGSISAQENLYHHVGDTIVGRSPIYFYDWWNEQMMSDSVELKRQDVLPPHRDGAILRYNYTEKPLNIIGLSGALMCFDEWDNEVDSTYYQEYLLLYEADSTGYYRLDSVAWDLRAPCRTLYMPTMDKVPWDPCDSLKIYPHYVKMYEYYFAKPSMVIDSFYVGTTTHSEYIINREPGVSMNSIPEVWCYTETGYGRPDCGQIRKFDYIFYPIHDTIYRYFDSVINWTPYEFRRVTDRSFMLIFPIVEVVCSEPSALEVRMVDSTSYELVWSGDDNVAWEALVISAGDTLSDDAAVWCDTTSFLMSGLDLQADYMAYVRGICIYEGDTVRTDWRNVPFSTPDSATLGLQTPDAFSATLSPNPTSGKVKVSASEPMRQVAVYDMVGKEVFSAKAVVPKTEWDLDLSSLPSGTYIVKIATKSRTATRKLIVE